jgi:predicted lipid carrier protein YhbT
MAPQPNATLAGAAALSPLADLPRRLIALVPIGLMQPVLDRIATHVATARPRLFARLGPHIRKRYLIDPTDLPFVLVLIPDATQPHLKAYARAAKPDSDACIAGRFLNLLKMVDTSYDGDALFFSRDLRVSGDIDAVVALRNALDDCDGTIMDTVAGAFGPLSGPAAFILSTIRRLSGSRPAA